MFRIRNLLALIILGVAAYWAGPTLVKGYALKQVNNTFARMGYAQPRYDVTAFTWHNMSLQNIQLEPEGISTIDSIDATFSFTDLIRGRINTVTVNRPDLIFGADDPAAPAKTPDFSGLSRFSLQDIPAKQIEINDLSLSYASESFNPSITGKISILTDDQKTRKLVLNLESEQKDLTMIINGNMTEDVSRKKSLKLEFPEIRFDIPGARLSRASGKLDVSISPNAPMSIQGEVTAGAMKIGNLPLDGLTLVASGTKPDLSIIGNAAITGLPQSNLSLRVSEDAKGARLLVQLSGEAPQALLNLLAPGAEIPLPAQQKFALALDLNDKDMWALLSPPYNAAEFLYLDDQKPTLAATLSCPTFSFACVMQLPQTRLSAAQISPILGPMLSERGLSIEGGDALVSGILKGAYDADGNLSLTTNVEAAGNNMAIGWQTLHLTDLNFALSRQNDGLMTIANLSAKTLDGKISAGKISLTGRGEGSGSITLDKINLEKLNKVASIKGLDISGEMSGTIPISFRNGKLIAGSDSKLASLSGQIHYAPTDYPAFLSGDDDRMNILRQALQDYQFDEMTLTFSGDLTGNLQATLAAKGRNETLFGERPIHINLNISGPLAPTLRQLMPTINASSAPQTETEPTP